MVVKGPEAWPAVGGHTAGSLASNLHVPLSPSVGFWIGELAPGPLTSQGGRLNLATALHLALIINKALGWGCSAGRLQSARKGCRHELPHALTGSRLRKENVTMQSGRQSTSANSGMGSQGVSDSQI